MSNEPEGKYRDGKLYETTFILKVEEAKQYTEVSEEEFGTWIDDVDAGFCMRNVHSLANTFNDNQDVP
eukprot:5447996-Ditylum_brightwellii.AAC.1